MTQLEKSLALNLNLTTENNFLLQSYKFLKNYGLVESNRGRGKSDT